MSMSRHPHAPAVLAPASGSFSAQSVLHGGHPLVKSVDDPHAHLLIDIYLPPNGTEPYPAILWLGTFGTHELAFTLSQYLL